MTTRSAGGTWRASRGPEGNVTGVTVRRRDTMLAGKRLELHQGRGPAGPRGSRSSTTERTRVPRSSGAGGAAGGGRPCASRSSWSRCRATDYERAFADHGGGARGRALRPRRATVLTRDRKQIIERAARYRLPAMYEWRELVEVGGLMAYGSRVVTLSRRVVAQVDKLLKGARPADLPVERPTQFALVINLQTAEALGMTLPPLVLFQADEVLK